MSTFGGLEPQNLPKRSSEQVFGRLGKWAHSGLEPNKQRCLDYSNLIAKLISEQTPKSWHSDDSLKQWPVEPHYLLYPGSPSQPFFEWFWNCKDSIVLVKVYFINNSRGLFFWWFLTSRVCASDSTTAVIFGDYPVLNHGVCHVRVLFQVAHLTRTTLF